LLWPLAAGAVIINPGDVVINEVAWMGTEGSANDEWMELKNNTAENIRMDGWLLRTTDGKIKAYITGELPAHGFYLLERTDDNTVANVKANFIYKGSLSNTGQSLELIKDANTYIDSASFSSWPAGDNTTKQTMERTADGEWKTSKSPGGTPKAENSDGIAVASSEESSESATEYSAAVASATYYDNIFINEIMPAPEGPDDELEWIEIYNGNSAEVNLQGWEMRDTTGAATAYIFKESAKMGGYGYLVLKRPETKITLNNDEDGITLAFPGNSEVTKKVADTVTYESAPANLSYNKTNNGWQWSKDATPGKKNVISEKPAEIALLLSNEEPGENESIAVAGVSESFGENLNAISNTLDKSIPLAKSPVTVFLIALSITIISGIMVIVLKSKLFRKNT